MKKVIVAISIALTTVMSANAQELSIDEVDAFTGKITKVTYQEQVGKGKEYSLYLIMARLTDVREKPIFSMIFKTNAGLGCAGSLEEYVMFKFTDGSVLRYNGFGEVDCDKTAMSMFEINLNDFKDKTVEKIRLKRHKSLLDYDVEGEYTITQLINAVK